MVGEGQRIDRVVLDEFHPRQTAEVGGVATRGDEVVDCHEATTFAQHAFVQHADDRGEVAP
jgi:hypothetical protein